MLQTKKLTLDEKKYRKEVLIYSDTNSVPKGTILYFHGGGLLYGEKTDLPNRHIQQITEAGYIIASFDYPLSPTAKLPLIFQDICASILHYIANKSEYGATSLPYILWGRSAGAYLCLLAAAHGNFPEAPKGILSYYGYGFLCDNWFQSPSPFYKTFPPVGASCLTAIPQTLHACGDLDTHYSVYVYARQTGCWKDLIYEGREKFFFLDYSLRTCDQLPSPLFCAHSTADPDVPYDEFLALCQKYHAQRHIVSCSEHDFDRNADSSATKILLDSSISFLDQCICAPC